MSKRAAIRSKRPTVRSKRPGIASKRLEIASRRPAARQPVRPRRARQFGAHATADQRRVGRPRPKAPEATPRPGAARLNFPRQRAGTPDGNACRTREPPAGICDDQSTPHRTTAPESPGGDGRSPSRSCVRTPSDNAPERSRATRQRAGRPRRVKLEDRAPEDATSARRRLGRPRAKTLVEDARESPATFKTAWRNQIRSPTLIHVESNPPLSGKHQKIFTDQDYKLLS